MKIIYNKLIPFKGFRAINLLGIVFARKEYRPLSAVTIQHEMIHTEQMIELGYIFFYFLYIMEWIIKMLRYGSQSYRNISFEREAYTWQNEHSYLQNRKRYIFLKYL
jgi:hypothetical protein